MPYVQPLKSKQQEEEDKKNNQLLATSENIVESNVGGGSSQEASPAGGATGWTNLNTYIDANQGNDAKIANQMTDYSSAREREAQNARTSFSDQASELANQNTIRDSGIIDKLGSDASAITEDDDLRAQFYRQKAATYQGPDSAQQLDTFSTMRSKADNLEQLADSVSSFDGRQSLLDELYKDDSRYSGGEKLLDNLIVSGGDTGRQTLNDINQQYSDYYDNNVQSHVDAAQKQFEDARNTTNQTRNQTNAALQNSIGDVKSKFRGYQSQANAKNSQIDSLYGQLKGNLGQGFGYDKVGLNKEQIDWLRKQGLNTDQLIEKGAHKKFGDYVSSDERATWNALAELAGLQSDYDFSTSGSDGSAFSTTDKATQAKDYFDLIRGVEDRIKSENERRDNEFSSLKDSDYRNILNTVAGNEFDQDFSYAINPNEFLSRTGYRLDAGDVANDEERQKAVDLVQSLGLNPTTDLNDDYQEQGVYNFDREQFKSQYDQFLDAVNAYNNPISSTSSYSPGAPVGTFQVDFGNQGASPTTSQADYSKLPAGSYPEYGFDKDENGNIYPVGWTGLPEPEYNIDQPKFTNAQTNTFISR